MTSAADGTREPQPGRKSWFVACWRVLARGGAVVLDVLFVPWMVTHVLVMLALLVTGMDAPPERVHAPYEASAGIGYVSWGPWFVIDYVPGPIWKSAVAWTIAHLAVLAAGGLRSFMRAVERERDR